MQIIEGGPSKKVKFLEKWPFSVSGPWPLICWVTANPLCIYCQSTTDWQDAPHGQGRKTRRVSSAWRRLQFSSLVLQLTAHHGAKWEIKATGPRETQVIQQLSSQCSMCADSKSADCRTVLIADKCSSFALSKYASRIIKSVVALILICFLHEETSGNHFSCYIQYTCAHIHGSAWRFFLKDQFFFLTRPKTKSKLDLTTTPGCVGLKLSCFSEWEPVAVWGVHVRCMWGA